MTFEDAVLLGSYVYRANFGSDPFHLDSVKLVVYYFHHWTYLHVFFRDMILDLVPEHTYDEYQHEDWETVSIHCIQT